MTRVLHTDKELLHLMAMNDKSAFDSIYHRYFPLVYNAAFKRLKNPDQCKDIVQEIFTDLWIRRDKVEIQNLPSYLLTATRYQVYKSVEKRQASEHFFQPFKQMMITGFGADGNVIEKELSTLFKVWLDTLPDKRRQIFILHFADNLSTKEISLRLDIPQKTVQNQLGIAADDLRGRLATFLLAIV